MTLGRGVLLALIVVGALALALLLGIGAVPGRWQLVALFGTCLLVAVAAVLLPASWRTKAGPLVVAFVAAAGVVPVFVRPASEEPARPRTNAHYLADLVAKGPFTETLTPPLVFWTCAGVRGFLYAEVTVSPNPNAYLPFTTETVGALLRYGDRMTKLATT